jgi:hypothetical protein
MQFTTKISEPHKRPTRPPYFLTVFWTQTIFLNFYSKKMSEEKHSNGDLRGLYRLGTLFRIKKTMLSNLMMSFCLNESYDKLKSPYQNEVNFVWML